jgi:energy-coupling factor transporter ATP-binding protein EcfA2
MAGRPSGGETTFDDALARLASGEVRTHAEALGLAARVHREASEHYTGGSLQLPLEKYGYTLRYRARSALEAIAQARGWRALDPGELNGAAIRSVTLRQIGGFASASLTFGGAGWHVVLGDNGSGKSTLLRAIGVALLQDAAGVVAQPWGRWVRSGAEEGLIDVNVGLDGAGQSRQLALYVWPAGGLLPQGAAEPVFVLREPGGGLGLFFAGFGPFRRFDAGADASFDRSAAQPAVAPVLSLFDAGLALRAPLLWLRSLRILELQAAAEAVPSTATQKLAAVKTLLNHGGLLPAGVRFLDIRAEPLTARFDDGHGGVLTLEALSDGYRSVLSLVMELLRLMDDHFGEALLAEVRPERAWVDQPGVVLIDEVDAHLHPSWQQEIGASLTRVFPKVQFIVTTHSPLVARAATGTVHHLRAPQGEEVGTQVEAITGVALDRLRWGGVLEALEGPAFDLPTAGQSAAGLAKLERLAMLRQARRRRALTPDEDAELRYLDAVFMPTEGL